MAHKKAGGTKARQGGNRAGKRLGVKVFGGEKVKTGQIILRQRGSLYKAGEDVGVGRDFTLFALKEGVISFRSLRGVKKVSII